MDLHQSVFLFRKAMLKAKSEGFQFELLDLFPVNCCEFTSCLLARFLIEKRGLSNVQIVMGENRHKKSQRHIWLRVDDIDIDITANQFSSTDKTVFADKSSEWHKRYRIYKTEVPDSQFKHFNKQAKKELLHDYKKIIDHMGTLNKLVFSSKHKKHTT